MQKNIDNSSIIRTCNTMACPGKLLSLVVFYSVGCKTKPFLLIAKNSSLTSL